MLSTNNIYIDNHCLLGDCGYDSVQFKNILASKNCKYIIPINKKNKYDDQMKLISENTNDTIKKLVSIKKIQNIKSKQTMRKANKDAKIQGI